MEDGSRPFRVGGPYTQPETCIYESIDNLDSKLPTSPTCPPRSLPSLPPPREEHLYQPDRPPVPMIVFEGEKGSNPYLQVLADKDKSKMDPEVRSTGSGDYTSMRSVSIKKEDLQNLSAVNRLAIQTAQGFNEDNYMVFMENAVEQ